MHSFTEYVNPYLGELLRNIALDKSFVRGEGCYLYDQSGNRYLDCIAAYGALPFGHNPPEIWEAVADFRAAGEPNFVQPSYLDAAGALAQRLVELAPHGLRCVTFTNSGAEAVEAALKLCRSATGRKGILATRNSFHGKTLGALSATGNPAYQAPFGAPVEGFDFVEYGDLAALEDKIGRAPGKYAAFIVEPIQGEGGIVEPPRGYLAGAREICARYGVLLVADEIQTGLGRTGRLFACEEEGVAPDLLLLAKALGGGLLPIGACLSTESAYNADFALKHSSTFAGNSLACRVGLRVLELLTGGGAALLDEVRKQGALLKEGLTALQREYPHIVRSVRGRGLMLGLELGIERRHFAGSLLGIAAEQELLAPAVSAYLLNREKIRVAPTLNGGSVIRIEPPLTITAAQCRRALEGITAALAVLHEANTAKFFSFLVSDKFHQAEQGETVFPDPAPPAAGIHIAAEPLLGEEAGCAEAAAGVSHAPAAENGAGRFAFLVHPLDLQSYSQFDPSLLLFGEAELACLAKKWSSLVRPFVISQVSITSESGARACGEFIVVPRTAGELAQMPREEALQELREALKLARAGGACIAGLGAYTSVVSRGGLYLKDEGIPLTTGNSYTVVSAVEAVSDACTKLGILPQRSAAAIIGAAGSIGRGVALLLSETVGSLVLVGNPHSKNKAASSRMLAAAAEIYRYLAGLLQAGRLFPAGSLGDRLSRCGTLPPPEAPLDDFIAFAHSAALPGGPIRITTSLKEALSGAGIVICATSSRERLIQPGDLPPGALVCDISRPPNVSAAVEQERPDVLVIDGGVVELPGRPGLGWNFGFPRGLAYACMAETIMLALERHYSHFSLGSSGVNLESILQAREWAARHGFKLAGLRSFDRPLSEACWRRLFAARRNQEVRS
jgi:acetylornithine/succinyldiaminopimelate/putrescine aminotransferase/predicted amino acid dehydrogenase